MSGDTTIDGGEAMARALAAHGVRTVFCLSGAAHSQLLRGLSKLEPAPAVISTRHETSTVAAADGYARVSGKTGVALIKDEQGLANAVTGVITAQSAGTPVVVLVSLRPTSWIEAHHEAVDDPLALVRPLAKWVRTAPSPGRLVEYMAEAFHQAAAGRTGVAVLGVRQEFGRAPVSAAPAAPPKTLAPASRPAPAPEAVEAAAALLAGAERPMILVGAGAARSQAGAAILALAETLGAPVLGHGQGRGVVAEDDRLGFGWPLAQVAARHADVVLALGVRLGQRFGFGLPPRFAEAARFIQVDLSAEEIGRHRPIDVPIVADVRRAAEGIHTALRAAQTPRRDAAWVNAAMSERLARLQALEGETNGAIHPLTLARRLMDRWPSDAVYVGDGADIQNWMLGTLRLNRPRTFVDLYPFGSMGVGTPLALGAAAATAEEARDGGGPARAVVLVTGDGSFGFYCSELNGAQMAGLRLGVVISNDGAWGTEKHGHLKLMGEAYNCELGQADYHLVAHAYGCGGEKVDAASEIGPALDRMLAAEAPYVLNVLTDPLAGALRKSDPHVVTVAFEDIAKMGRDDAPPSVL